MRKPIQAGLAVSLVSILPIFFASPAFALMDRLTLTVDCVVGETEEDDHNIAPGETLTITLTNCDGLTLTDAENTGNATMNSTVIDSTGSAISGNNVALVVTANSTPDRIVANLEINGDIDIDVYGAGPAVQPDSTLLATKTITLNVGAPDTMIRESDIGSPTGDTGDGDVWVGGDQACAVEPGPHVYSTLNFTVTEAGEYQFIATDVSPADEDMYWGQPKYPASDPFLAVYQSFDPANPETGIVTCNDDSNDDGNAQNVLDSWTDAVTTDSYDALQIYNGNLIDDQWPWMVTDLTPGDYTMVYMPFSAGSTEDIDAGHFADHSDNSSLTWTPSDQSVVYDMWGPAGGIVFEQPTLANTGFDSSLGAWTMASLLVAGVALSLMRRRLAQR